MASLVAQRVKSLPAMWETWVQSLGQEDPLEKEMATHSSILARKIPWTEPGVPKIWIQLSVHMCTHTHTHTVYGVVKAPDSSGCKKPNFTPASAKMAELLAKG